MIRKSTPQQQLIASFAIVILAGSVVLMLPGVTTQARISYVDALFTSTSAVCVTGLVVNDTGTDFTKLGQWVLLALIQVGGLGIMTFSTIFLLMVGRRPSLRQDAALEDAFSHSPMRSLHSLILSVVLFTLAAELIGTACYFLHWISEFPAGDAMFMSLFHAVSAFCNAGFCLFPDGFTRYQGNVLINLTTICLIIIGGIGFLVLLELHQRYGPNWIKDRRPRKTLSLHTRLTLLTTLILVVAGAVFFFWEEYNDILTGMTLSNKILISFFQSVTARTAGFNTVDFTLLANSTLFSLLFLCSSELRQAPAEGA